jgi:hypothetical protein
MPWQGSHGATFDKFDEGTLIVAKAYELDAGPDDAIRSRPRISQLTRDCHIDGGAKLKTHRNATAWM